MAGIYIHIPFCASKCAYCDFYSVPPRRSGAGEIYDQYADAIVKEASLRSEELKEDVRTLYVGGGTPSLMPMPSFKRLVEGISASVDLAGVAEFTVEANPEDLSEQYLEDLLSVGVNRISIGVQTFDEEMLRSLNRRHDGLRAHAALVLLTESGINHSADLIYGLPGQTLDTWEKQVRLMLAHRPMHLSAYLLSYEPGTRLYARRLAGKIEETSDELAQQMYDKLCDLTREHGYEHYEISNFALPGFRSRHNSAYWNLTPYLGLGAAAHSFDGLVRRYNPSDVRKYISNLNDEGKSCFEVDEEDEYNRFNDFLITSLRTSDGVAVSELLGRCPESCVVDFDSRLMRLLDRGMLELTDVERLRIPELRWLLSDAILRDLIIVS